jgi:hypothetical protein
MSDWRNRLARETSPSAQHATASEMARLTQHNAEIEATIQAGTTSLRVWLAQNEGSARLLLGRLASSPTRDVPQVYFGYSPTGTQRPVVFNRKGLRLAANNPRHEHEEQPASARDAVVAYARKVKNDPIAVRDIVTYVEECLNHLAKHFK